MRCIALLLILSAVTGCLSDLGPAGVDCGPVPQPKCRQQAEFLSRMGGEGKPAVWAVHLRGDGEGGTVVYVDGSRTDVMP